MPFQKGKSGNPGGRPKGSPKVIRELKKASVRAAKTLISLLDSEDEDIRLKASKEIVDRELGRPAQAIQDVQGNNIMGAVVFLPPKNTQEQNEKIQREQRLKREKEKL